MFRWIAIFAALALAVGVAYGQSSSPQTQPTLPLGQNQTMGHMMNSPMMNDGAMGADAHMAPMMQMMRMMGAASMGSAMMSQDMMGPMCHGQMDSQAGAPASYLEARLAFARSELAIGDAQKPAWEAYVTALRSQVQPMSAHMTTMHHAMMDTAAFPERFDARISFLESQVGSLKAVRDAAVQLYGQLDAGQKQKADRLLPVSLCI